MFRLYYNASHPLEILQSKTILTSKVNRDRGVSLSSVLLNCHGAFTFVFKPDLPWYNQCTKVKYGQFKVYDFTHKTPIFKDEKEYWSKDPIVFEIEQIEKVIFRYDSPARRIHPRKTVKIAKQLEKEYPDLYEEMGRLYS